MKPIEEWLNFDYRTTVKPKELDGDFFTADNLANRIGVIVRDHGVDSPIEGGIVGYVIRSDEKTVVVNGQTSGNRGWIDLPASAYVCKGPVDIIIKNGATTIGACHGYINRSTTDTIVDPGKVIPSLPELLAELTNLRAATSAANTATSNANAATSSANTAASNANAATTAANAAAGTANTAASNADAKAGLANTAAGNANAKATLANTAAQTANTAASNADAKAGLANTAANNANTKATLANTAAQTANTAASNADEKAALANTAAGTANASATAADAATAAANAAAGKIDNMTAAATTSPEGSQASVTVTEVNGHKHIAFQIPKGDKGKDFHIAFTFASIAAMEAYSGDIELYDYAMIDTGNVQDEDTGKLYCYEQDEEWHYIGDLSGAQGIKGETGTGIDHVTLNNDYTLTIYYDDGTQTTTTSIRGATGITPNIAIGTVTTLLPDQQAYVTRDPSSTAENPVFNFGIPKGDTGAVDNVYGTTVPMSESDSTSVYNAIGSKLNKNQGTSNAGKFMKVGADGELTPENVPDPTNKADKVTNATAGNFAGLDATGNLTDSGKSAEDFAGAIYKTATPGSIITIEDGADDLPVKELKVAIEPVQDLQGYDYPWPGGAVPNLIPDGTDTNNGYEENKYLTSDGATPSSEDFYISEYFAVDPNTVYTLSKTPSMSSSAPSICFYDSNKTYISGVAVNQQDEQQITTPADAAYARCSQRKDMTVGFYQFELGNTATELMPYSNVCPIEGWTGAKVTRTGKNLYDISRQTVTNYNTFLGVSPKPNTDYVFSTDKAITGLCVAYSDDETMPSQSQNTGWTDLKTVYNNTFLSFNSGSHKWLRLMTYESGGRKERTLQLELGSTATAYEHYQGETYSISFPSEAGTVYGGSLTIAEDGSGVLTVDMAEVDLGTLTWSKIDTASGHWRFWTVLNAMLLGGNMLSSQYKQVGASEQYMGKQGIANQQSGNNTLAMVSDERFADVSDFKTAMSGAQLVYELATPVTYSLTPGQVKTLLGVNNIWADTGDIIELIYSVNTDTAMALYEKADKVVNATAGNFAALDAEGNLKDSGKKPSDFLTQHQDISGKVDKNQGAVNAGKALGINDQGQVVPAGPILTQAAVVDLIYPVGSIYMSVASTSPATLFDGTTWEQLKDKFLLGAGDTYTAGDTGGNASVSYTPEGTNSGGAVGYHTLTVNEIPSHNHSFTGSAVNTGNQSAGHTHTYKDYYATTTGGTAISVAQLASHNHPVAIGSWDGGHSGKITFNSNAMYDNSWNGSTKTIGNTGSGNSHTHGGANTNSSRTSDGISANHTHSVTASGSIGNIGGGGAHNHGFTQPTFTGTEATINTMPPYLAVYMWKRTA